MTRPLTPAELHAIETEVQAVMDAPWRVAPREFYEADETIAVTQKILGCLLLRVTAGDEPGEGSDPLPSCGGRIVEAEAYLGEHDPAAHAARGRTPVTDVMYRAGGHAYVYQIYGMHNCLNATSLPPGLPGCVLIRAIEPLFGVEAMRVRRGLPSTRLKDLCSGPGRLCQALGIDRTLTGSDLTAGPLLILSGGPAPAAILSGPRVGITKAADWPLRFWIDGSPWVSGRTT